MQAYLDNIKAKTGKTADDFRILATEQGLKTYPELMAWLKTEFGLGHGHANLIAHMIVHHGEPEVSSDDAIAAHFGGAKANWRKPYDELLAHLNTFGPDVTVAPTKSYLSFLRGKNKFGIVQISTDRIDIGVKRKGIATTERFEAAGSWNNMATHRVRISDPTQIDAEVLGWLKQAYDAA